MSTGSGGRDALVWVLGAMVSHEGNWSLMGTLFVGASGKSLQPDNSGMNSSVLHSILVTEFAMVGDYHNPMAGSCPR